MRGVQQGVQNRVNRIVDRSQQQPESDVVEPTTRIGNERILGVVLNWVDLHDLASLPIYLDSLLIEARDDAYDSLLFLVNSDDVRLGVAIAVQIPLALLLKEGVRSVFVLTSLRRRAELHLGV